MAIHEAMEQQTISIAKAGICTVLNSRTSVLAAANPVYGRYDDLKSAAENIDMMTTILSRFDLIFIVRDVRDEQRDMDIARHVMGVHIQASDAGRRKERDAEIDLKTMKDFVRYCRAKCSPRLSAEASRLLASEYVNIRAAVKARADEQGGRTQPAHRHLRSRIRPREGFSEWVETEWYGQRDTISRVCWI